MNTERPAARHLVAEPFRSVLPRDRSLNRKEAMIALAEICRPVTGLEADS
jgi:hypothetical protein